MSRSWAGGSTSQWRRIRAHVLARDRWVCGLCGDRIDPRIRHPDPMSAQVHHLDGRAYGDDPDRMQAAHRRCNLAAGDPTTAPDPKPTPQTRW